ncbi:hypothetical protein FACS1894172_21070 [Spirochaetia bacterium]|nr:hypothetical protein FACS1894164_02800 [Spirochaetia bacterium]GHU37597.1 hypothetical protein FACS1894172_21070 [Spirochaetia bacterium]
MSIVDRLGRVIKSQFDDIHIFAKDSNSDWEDPDLADAMDEINDYLRGKPSRPKPEPAPLYPVSLLKDFAELEVPAGASAEVCKTSYKRLLKLHHPDRHAGHPEEIKKATEKSARVNAAYDRIEQWRQTGHVE